MSFRRRRVPKFDYYSSVKKTYETHLIELLKTPFYHKVKDICEVTKTKNKGNTKILKAFQAEMANIKKWDYDELKSASKFVINKAKASYVPKLIRAVIVSNVKLLTATRSRKKLPNDIETQIPEPIQFFHKCFIEIGRSFYTEPYLVCDQGQQPGQRLQNLNDSIDLIERAIKKTINMFLPYDLILDAYLANVDEDSDSEEDEPEPESADESESDDESEIDSDEESDVESIADSDDDESQHGGSEVDLPDDESDTDSVHSNHDIIQNDFSQDEEITIESDNESIGEGIDEEFNFIPMKTESASESEAPVPHKEEIKTVKVTEPVNVEQPQQTQKSDGSRKIVFFNDAEDL